ncbi:MAG: hypothetical protein WEB00_13620 [Dehalococcoidia bacterium]
MGKGEELAGRFEQANNDFIKAVKASSDESWQSKSAAEGRQVNVIATTSPRPTPSYLNWSRRSPAAARYLSSRWR